MSYGKHLRSLNCLLQTKHCLNLKNCFFNYICDIICWKRRNTQNKKTPFHCAQWVSWHCTYFLSSPPGYHGKRTYMFIAIFEIPARVVYKYRILIKVKVNPVLYFLFLTERLKTNFDNPFFLISSTKDLNLLLVKAKTIYFNFHSPHYHLKVWN